MNTDIIQQEILLFTDTTFSHRQYSERESKDDTRNLSDKQKLERACWDGLLTELLPEIITNKKLSPWQIWDTEFALQIELSEYPSGEAEFSINPYYFLKTVNNN